VTPFKLRIRGYILGFASFSPTYGLESRTQCLGCASVRWAWLTIERSMVLPRRLHVDASQVGLYTLSPAWMLTSVI